MYLSISLYFSPSNTAEGILITQRDQPFPYGCQEGLGSGDEDSLTLPPAHPRRHPDPSPKDLTLPVQPRPPPNSHWPSLVYSHLSRSSLALPSLLLSSPRLVSNFSEPFLSIPHTFPFPQTHVALPLALFVAFQLMSFFLLFLKPSSHSRPFLTCFNPFYQPSSRRLPPSPY